MTKETDASDLPERPTVHLANGTAAEAAVQRDLESLFDRFDLSRFLITRDVRIEEGVLPHSHPVLTLSPGYPHEGALLASYIHEQMHWWSMECAGAADGRDEAVLEGLGVEFNDLPLEPPDGCGTVMSNLIHLHVCWLELEALAALMGEEWALQRVLIKPYYRAIYRAVVERREDLRDLFSAAGMGLPADKG